MLAQRLGTLQRANLEDAWFDEARDFTPWLAQAENIVLLGDAIGLDLEVQAVEKFVGPFRADILCRDTLRDQAVLIENQLQRTDHGHLGQLLTYAAGLQAVSVVWIAKRFTDEHRAALDWLNSITNRPINFFGLEIELWRIGDSPLAPKFNVISQPNDWSSWAQGGVRGELPSTEQLYLEYWTQLRQFLDSRGSAIQMRNPAPQYWTNIALGRVGFRLTAWNSIRDARSGVALVVDGFGAKRHFCTLRREHGSEIEAKLAPVQWLAPPDQERRRVSTVRPSMLSDRETWPALNQWFAETLEQWAAVFRPLVRTLGASDDQAATETVGAIGVGTGADREDEDEPY
jgi:hypothetical protein